MSLSDTDTTIVADLAAAGQRITTLTSELVSLQALMGNVATTDLTLTSALLSNPRTTHHAFGVQAPSRPNGHLIIIKCPSLSTSESQNPGAAQV